MQHAVNSHHPTAHAIRCMKLYQRYRQALQDQQYKSDAHQDQAATTYSGHQAIPITSRGIISEAIIKLRPRLFTPNLAAPTVPTRNRKPLTTTEFQPNRVNAHHVFCIGRHQPNDWIGKPAYYSRDCDHTRYGRLPPQESQNLRSRPRRTTLPS